MLPVIALVGRPNVGKSTLFNCFTKSREALVHDMPGVTRDRQYGHGRYHQKEFIVIDTGGLGEKEAGISELMGEQARLAIAEADLILFLVDARAGVMPGDTQLANKLRQLNKPVVLVVNKADGLDANIASADFYSLGLGEPQSIAASHQRGTKQLLAHSLGQLPKRSDPAESATPNLSKETNIKIAIIGRPNVGKSTLVNRLLGEDRVLTFDEPGTTRDSIAIPFEHHGQRYTLIDTAGVRRRTRIKETVEKFSVVKSLQAVESAHVVIYVLDARLEVADQDLRLLSHVIDVGRALVIAINKWDHLPVEQRDKMKYDIERKLEFVQFSRIHFISALHGTGVGNLYSSIKEGYHSAMKPLTTAILTRLLQKAVEQHTPPLSRGRRIQLRYAHPGGHNPPIIVVHGNLVEKLAESYRRYLLNFFRKRLKLTGTPLRIELRKTKNPYVKKKK